MQAGTHYIATTAVIFSYKLLVKITFWLGFLWNDYLQNGIKLSNTNENCSNLQHITQVIDKKILI